MERCTRSPNTATRWGIAAERLVPAGFGETKPILTNKTTTGRAANRRVEFRIVRDEP